MFGQPCPTSKDGRTALAPLSTSAPSTALPALGSNFGQPALGNPTGTLTTSISSGTSLFGTQTQPQTGSLFGQPQTSTGFGGLFGQTPQSTDSGLFGSSTTSSSGTNQTSQPLFQCGGMSSTNRSGRLFLKPAGFGGGTTLTGTTLKYHPTNGTDTMTHNGVSRIIRTRIEVITTMNEYVNKSLEELRVEDYFANRKGSGQGCTLTNLTKTTQSCQQGVELFLAGSPLFTFNKQVTGVGTSTTRNLFSSAASSVNTTSTNVSGFSFANANQNVKSTGFEFGRRATTTQPLFSSVTSQPPTFSFSPISTFRQNTPQQKTVIIANQNSSSPLSNQSSGWSLFGNKPAGSIQQFSFGSAPLAGTTPATNGTGDSVSGAQPTQNKPLSSSYECKPASVILPTKNLQLHEDPQKLNDSFIPKLETLFLKKFKKLEEMYLNSFTSYNQIVEHFLSKLDLHLEYKLKNAKEYLSEPGHFQPTSSGACSEEVISEGERRFLQKLQNSKISKMHACNSPQLLQALTSTIESTLEDNFKKLGEMYILNTSQNNQQLSDTLVSELESSDGDIYRKQIWTQPTKLCDSCQKCVGSVLLNIEELFEVNLKKLSDKVSSNQSQINQEHCDKMMKKLEVMLDKHLVKLECKMISSNSADTDGASLQVTDAGKAASCNSRDNSLSIASSESRKDVHPDISALKSFLTSIDARLDGRFAKLHKAMSDLSSLDQKLLDTHIASVDAILELVYDKLYKNQAWNCDDFTGDSKYEGPNSDLGTSISGDLHIGTHEVSLQNSSNNIQRRLLRTHFCYNKNDVTSRSDIDEQKRSVDEHALIKSDSVKEKEPTSDHYNDKVKVLHYLAEKKAVGVELESTLKKSNILDELESPSATFEKQIKTMCLEDDRVSFSSKADAESNVSLSTNIPEEQRKIASTKVEQAKEESLCSNSVRELAAKLSEKDQLILELENRLLFLEKRNRVLRRVKKSKKREILPEEVALGDDSDSLEDCAK